MGSSAFLVNNPAMLKIFIAIAALIVLPAPAGAEIYKCRLANGQTEIANAPCATSSSTIAVRPDEYVSEAARRAAELEVERMRAFVAKREAAQRADQAAERARQPGVSQPLPTANASPPPPAYGDTDECLHKVGQMVLEASQRMQIEAACRNLVRPPPTNVPIVAPAYPQGTHFHPQQPVQPIPKGGPADGPKIAAPLLKK
ncbi:MAG: hypothetical protein CVU31_03435 [Betaproteobacteria bacterium HGW-Betaproteobacteria-4]|jgi:hypothetical protein|nr:MAG: hypothetical protein CVU31_03435 [Betaproteobacteria bacterium HGW-Betaproteobacteria-4]